MVSRAVSDGDYAALVAARKACRICVAQSPGRIRNCAEFAFDPPVVSLWEQWLGHPRPLLLVVGQDFGNVDYFVRNGGHDEPGNKTNDNLRRLLIEAGFAVGAPPSLDDETRVFLTNSILCLPEARVDDRADPRQLGAQLHGSSFAALTELAEAACCRRHGRLRLAGGATSLCLARRAAADFACRRRRLACGRRHRSSCRRPLRPAGADQPTLAATTRGLAQGRGGGSRTA